MKAGHIFSSPGQPEVNPRQGTETRPQRAGPTVGGGSQPEVNPRQGTETSSRIHVPLGITSSQPEVNPRQGTETLIFGFGAYGVAVSARSESSPGD